MRTAIKADHVSISYKVGDFKDIGLKEWTLRHLKHNYHVEKFLAVHDVSFELREGDMMGIIGVNGAGKSTLLKAVIGVMEPREGHIERNGSVSALLELASGFDGDLTVRENAYLRGAMLGYTRAFMDQTYEIVTGFIDAFKQAYQEIPISKLNGCVCPECSSELNIEPKLVGCSNSNCQFKITRIVASKSLGEADLSVLINEKETGVISGFIKRGTDKKSDKLFNAALKLNKKEDGTYEIQFHFPVVKFDLPCPICSGEMESNSSAIKCKVESCGMTIWRSINKNPIPESEMRLLIENGVTNAIDGFVSSKGTIFTGKLIINKDEKRVSFNFDGINSTSKEATTEKCFKACGGTYDLVGFKYICNSCEHWIPVKPKNAVKAFTKNQLASLAKGKFVAQKVKILNDEDKEVEVKKEFFIDPDSGRLFSRNFIEPKKA